jgi:enoyl-CoA hydratase/carnithine racemase
MVLFTGLPKREPDPARVLTPAPPRPWNADLQSAADTYPFHVNTELQVRRTPGVVEVTFNRPERRNAFTAAMYAGMRELCDELRDDESTRVLVLRGAGGKAFAAGNEISDFLDRDAVAYEESIRELLVALFELPQVTIAAVDGACVGGGLAVATHCDLRICTPASRFGYPIARTLGNALSASIVYRCAAVFGESLTREMLLTSRLTTADRAYSVGAVMSVVDNLDNEVDHVVTGLLEASAVTMRATKSQLATRAAVLEAEPDTDAALLAEVYNGPDFKEGVRAFLAKEKPAFTR